ncbi:MAG: hypothetical protein HYY02_08610 [Chloroflexi bacterium]|nr:hypothetical protein [Chloroflexota bacterium]
MYCGHEIVAATIEEIIHLAIIHGCEQHGLVEGKIPEVTITIWRRHIHDVAAPA